MEAAVRVFETKGKQKMNTNLRGTA